MINTHSNLRSPHMRRLKNLNQICNQPPESVANKRDGCEQLADSVDLTAFDSSVEYTISKEKLKPVDYFNNNDINSYKVTSERIINERTSRKKKQNSKTNEMKAQRFADKFKHRSPSSRKTIDLKRKNNNSDLIE